MKCENSTSAMCSPPLSPPLAVKQNMQELLHYIMSSKQRLKMITRAPPVGTNTQLLHTDDNYDDDNNDNEDTMVITIPQLRNLYIHSM